MSYHDLLSRYDNQQTTANHNIYLFFQSPKSLTTAKEVAYRDGQTAQDIAKLERYIENMKDYRKALAERYAQLETMSYSLTLRLERYVHWKGHKEYIITITKEYEDGTKNDELREVYPGKERHKAIARFEELKKARPGIEAELDIQKSKWER